MPSCSSSRLAPHIPGAPRIFAEFWSAKQRQMHPLHYAVSYRASFKPELPDFFIRNYTVPGQVVADPFGGRGTTLLQASLLGRSCWHNDVHPLSERIAYPKTHPVSLRQLQRRLEEIDLETSVNLAQEKDLGMFYHPRTYCELLSLKKWLSTHRTDEDRFIELLALSKLHGHSSGFFSAYSFPQMAISADSQKKINKKRGETPVYRNVRDLLLKKARLILKEDNVEHLKTQALQNRLTTNDARSLSDWPSEAIDLIVTSPPFLNKVNYLQDTWLESWFCDIDLGPIQGSLVQTPSFRKWKEFICTVLQEIHRVLRPKGLVALEVGEIAHNTSTINLDETVEVLLQSLNKESTGLLLRKVFVQSQKFTKLSNCFNIKNNIRGTNTNRVLLLEKT